MAVKPHDFDIVTVDILEVSTGHITKEDDKILKECIDVGPEKHPQVIMAHAHGFMVSSWHNFEDNPEDFEQELLKIGHSPAYINLLRVANQTGSKWISIDSDASHYNWLPFYHW